MDSNNKSLEVLVRENELLSEELAEVREVLSAIQRGEVDALVIINSGREQIFTIKGAEEPYRLFVEQMSQGAVTLNLSGTILYCNRRFASLLNVPMEHIIGSSIYQFVAPENQPILKSVLQKGSLETCKTELTFIASGENKPIPFDLTFNPLTDDELQVICLVATDLTEQKQAENRLRSALEEKEVLLKEVHHRVKNNMQVISSLLKLQAENINDKRIADMFYESQNRVKAMALVHQKLYQSENLSQIDISVYIQGLMTNLIRSLNFDPGKIEVEVKIEGILLNMDTAIPCGLIINELVYNSLKYGFPENHKGLIRIELTRDNQGDELTLVISDNGIGLPKEFDFENAQTLGLQLVRMLTRQLDGTLELHQENGTTFRIHFRELHYRERI